MRRQHHVAVLAAFAVLHPDQHALTVDIGDLEGDYFGRAQAGAVGHAQRRLVLESRRRIEQRATSSGLNTTGSLRGSLTKVRCRSMSGRSSVTPKKKRSPDTALFMLDAC